MSLFAFAQRFIGEIRELPGAQQHPFIQWAHMLCNLGPDQPDEVPWCSSFMNALCWMQRLPRSKSAAARSWLSIGVPVPLEQAQLGDVVILSRGAPPSGHVGLFAGREGPKVHLLGGNQGNAVSVAPFDVSTVLGVRRVA